MTWRAMSAWPASEAVFDAHSAVPPKMVKKMAKEAVAGAAAEGGVKAGVKVRPCRLIG